MSNHRFIQVDPPKEELTLPANIVDFREELSVKAEDNMSLKFISTVATFTGIVVGDLLEIRNTDKETLIEKSLGIVEVGSVVSVNEIETITYDTSYKSNSDLINNFRATDSSEEASKLYKLPTNNFSLQIKSDNIVRYYEDPVDKSIMFMDLVESGNICSTTRRSQDTYGEFHDYGGGNTLALTTSYTKWQTGTADNFNNMTLSSAPVKFTIDEEGIYKFDGSFAIETGTVNRTISAAIFINGSIYASSEVSRTFSGASTAGSFSITTLVDLNEGDEVTVEFKADAAVTITFLNVSTNMTLLEGLGSTVCVDVWEHDRNNLSIVTLNNTDKLPFHNIVPYLNSFFLGE
jgi:hypothetical protein